MKNRIIALLLCVTMLVSLAPAILATEADSGGSEQANVADEYREFYNNLMACTTLEEANALLNTLSDEEFEVFVNSLSEDEYNALNEHMNALIAAAEDEGIVDYVYSAVNFTNVAPLVEWPAVTPTRGAYSLNATGDGEQAGDDNGLVLAKNAQYDPGTGRCTITLEAYTTGTVTTEVENVPTDIVLVLDQSGSMKDLYGTTYEEVYSEELSENSTYYVIVNGVYTEVRYSSWRDCWYYDSWLGLIPIQVTPKTDPNDTVEGHFQFYDLVSSTTRIEALKSAVTIFVNSVAEKAKGADATFGTEDDVNHRIAVVGFASQNGYGNNTELLSILGTNSGSVGIAYEDITDNDCVNVFQSMDTTSGQTMVNNAIEALDAQGATRTDLGLGMAARILDKDQISPDQQRNRVVVLFSDGAPTSSNGLELTVAESAIKYAGNIKSEHQATLLN